MEHLRKAQEESAMMAHLSKANDTHRLALSWLAISEKFKQLQHQPTILAQGRLNEETRAGMPFSISTLNLDTPDFAQCSSCRDVGQEMTIAALSMALEFEFLAQPHVGSYIYGTSTTSQVMKPKPLSTAEESGLVDRQVRCENCQWGGPSTYQVPTLRWA